MAVAVVASPLQASIGFGIGMLAAPIVALVDPKLTPGMVMMVATGVTPTVLVRERGHIDVHGAEWALVGRVPGIIAGRGCWRCCPPGGSRSWSPWSSSWASR